MAWTQFTLLNAVTTIQRSPTTLLGYLPGRQATIETDGFSGTIDLQTSSDGGVSWVDAQLINSDNQIVSGPISFSNDTNTYVYNVRANNLLLSANVTVATAGSISLYYFAGDTAGQPVAIPTT